MRWDTVSWAIQRVLGDWRKRRPKQFRDTPPPKYTSSILRLIRMRACRTEALTTIECAKWSQNNSLKSDLNGQPLALYGNEKPGPFLLTTDYVCDQCKHPRVTSSELISKLGLNEGSENFSERTFRRYINAEEPMPVIQFRRVVVNALEQGWLGRWQALGISKSITELTAARRAVLAVVRRAMERKSYATSKVPEITENEIALEVDKQFRLMEHEDIRVLDQRLKDVHFSTENQKFAKELLLSMMDKNNRP